LGIHKTDLMRIDQNSLLGAVREFALAYQSENDFLTEF